MPAGTDTAAPGVVLVNLAQFNTRGHTSVLILIDSVPSTPLMVQGFQPPALAFLGVTTPPSEDLNVISTGVLSAGIVKA